MRYGHAYHDVPLEPPGLEPRKPCHQFSDLDVAFAPLPKAQVVHENSSVTLKRVTLRAD